MCIAMLILSILNADPKIVEIPVYREMPEEDKFLFLTDPEELQRRRIHEFGGERWQFTSSKLDPDPDAVKGRAWLSLFPKFQPRTRWERERISLTLVPGDVFPVLDHVFVYEGPVHGDTSFRFRDVSQELKKFVPDRDEVTFRDKSQRILGRALPRDIIIGCLVDAGPVTVEKPASAKIYWATYPWKANVHETAMPAHVGDRFQIHPTATLKVTKIVPRQEIKGIGRLVGWVCFEDVELAAERKQAESVKEPK